MKVLVTGASGFLGSHVAEQLTRGGHDVRALVRKSSNRDFLERLDRIEFAYGGVEDAEKVAEAVKGVDAIIHSAGLVKARSADEFRKTNVEGTRNLIEAAKTHAPKLRRFVFVSSLTAAGPSLDGIPLEKDGAGPVTHYGRSKLDAERVVLAAKDSIPVTVLRPAIIYGPRDHEILVFFKSVKKGVLPTVGKGDSTMSMVFGSDCAEACVKAITADVPSGSVYFVDDGEPYPFQTMVEGIEEALGKKAFLRFPLPMPVIWLAAVSSELYGKLSNKAVMLNRDKINEIRQPHWVCSSARTRKDLDWEPRVSLREGTAITARWYEDNGWL
ncbi:MAG: NAD-dependent epimerase/dehydratase family protein [Polyangiaceae bacterium]|jgi:nucleoside-diphosphate-sugar epimerase